MHLFMVGLLAATALSDARFAEPTEEAMREAFAIDLADGVRAALAYVSETGGPEALARIRVARTDAFAITAFRKGGCRASAGRTGQDCDFDVAVDTVAGPIVRSVSGRFFVGPCGLTFDSDA